MLRRREIGTAPLRPAREAWATLTQLVVDTLERSPSISGDDVTAAMTVASRAGLILIAGGHLDHHPVVLVADSLHLSITTVSGAAALTLDERLEPVPGGASATTWTVFLPTPEPVAEAVRLIADGHAHLSAEEPPAESDANETSAKTATVDAEALARRAVDR